MEEPVHKAAWESVIKMMINVYFAKLKRSYDFKVDETAEVDAVLTEMTETIAQKEHLVWDAEEQGTPPFLLCDTERGLFLDPAATLEESKVRPGDTLLLV